MLSPQRKMTEENLQLTRDVNNKMVKLTIISLKGSKVSRNQSTKPELVRTSGSIKLNIKSGNHTKDRTIKGDKTLVMAEIEQAFDEVEITMRLIVQTGGVEKLLVLACQ